MRDLRSLAIESQNDELELEDEEERLSISESMDSVEGKSTAESLLTQSSRGSYPRINDPSSEQRRLEQRQKQIDYGKVTYICVSKCLKIRIQLDMIDMCN